jgi:hypothetical protein
MLFSVCSMDIRVEEQHPPLILPPHEKASSVLLCSPINAAMYVY